MSSLLEVANGASPSRGTYRGGKPAGGWLRSFGSTNTLIRLDVARCGCAIIVITTAIN